MTLMEQAIKEAIYRAVEKEPFARALKMELVALDEGHSVVEMAYDPAAMDEAFETACQTHGTIAVALNVNVTYVTSPEPGARLRAEAREVSKTNKTAAYDLKVTDQEGQIIASCQALAFRTGKPIPFL
jgi:acyl-CoA thioesterase